MRPPPSPLVGSLGAVTPFVAPEALEARLGRRFRLRLGANESTFGPSPRAVEAMARRAAEAQWYGDPNSVELREALSPRFGVPSDRLRVGAGIDGLLLHLCRAYLAPGRTAVTSLGGYPTFEFAVLPTGAGLERVPYRDDRPDLGALAERARAVAASMVYLANPDNPSGAVWGAAEVSAFRAALPAGCLLLLDEAYADYVPEGALPSVDADDPAVVRLRTFSKAHGLAGLRIGVAVLPEGMGEELDKVRGHFEVNGVAQAGALASLQDAEHLRRVVAGTDASRARLVEGARALGMPSLPSATNFVLLDADTRERAEALLERLLQAGVFVRKPALAPLDRCVRVTLGQAAEVQEFLEVLAAIR